MASEWDVTNLDEIIDVLTDYHANGSYEKLKENVELKDVEDYAVMIRTTNFEQENFTTSLKFINEHAYNFLEKSKVFPNDLIMNKIANAGSCYYMPDLGRPVSLAMNLFLIRINEEKAIPRFIYYYLKSNESYVKSFAEGSVTKTITKSAVRNLELKLPSKEIQSNIVKVLGTIEDKIELNRQMNQTLEQMAQGMFKSWFMDFDPVIYNALAKGNEIPEELQEKVEQCIALGENRKPLPEHIQKLFPSEFEFSKKLDKWIPKGWKIERLGNHLYIKGRIGWKGLKKSEYLKEYEGYSIINGSDFKDEQVDWDNCGWITKERYDESPEIQLKPNDILITKDGTIGKLAFVDTVYSPMSVASGVFVVRVESTELKTLFCWSFFKSPYFQELVKAKIDGSVIPHLYQRDFVEMFIAMPEIGIIEYFEDQLSGIYIKVFRNKEQIGTLTKLRDTLLPKLISGEIRVGDWKKNIETPVE